MLNIITITKDNPSELAKTIASAEALRLNYGIIQIVVDSSKYDIYLSNKEKFKNKKNIKLVRLNRLGISNAFNKGLESTKSKWVWFLNSGDSVYDNLDMDYFIKTIKLSNSDIIVFKIILGNNITKWPPAYKIWPPIQNWLPHPGSIFLRNKLIECGGFDNNYKIAMDADMWFKLFEKGSIIDCIPLVITKFEIGGISSNQKKLSIENVKIILCHFSSIWKIGFVNMKDNLKFFISSIINSVK